MLLDILSYKLLDRSGCIYHHVLTRYVTGQFRVHILPCTYVTGQIQGAYYTLDTADQGTYITIYFVKSLNKYACTLLVLISTLSIPAIMYI